MKKSLIASAVAAAVLAGPASAMKLEGPDYGIAVNVETGFYYQDMTGATGSSTGELKGAGINQIEIKGKRKVGNGLTVFGEIEVDYDPVDDGDDVKTDDMKLGVKGDFGTIQVGQFDFYYEDKISEALGAEHGDEGKVSEAGGTKDDRHIMWKNKFGSSEVAVDFRYNEADTQSSQYAFTLKNKASDNLTVAAGWATDKDDMDQMGVNAVMKMDSTKFTVAYMTEETSGGVQTDYMGFLIENQFGDTDLNLAVQSVDEEGSAERTEIAVGAGYELAKDFVLFADYAMFDKANDEDDVIEIGMKYEF